MKYRSICKRSFDDKNPIIIEADSREELREKEQQAFKEWKENGGLQSVLDIVNQSLES
jgi:hypothetical protein